MMENLTMGTTILHISNRVAADKWLAKRLDE
jgi:hypothetical protein